MNENPELARKIALLDARDKLLRQQMDKQTRFIGSCTDMCPERERYLRLTFQPSIFERDPMNQPDEYAMIKEYRRAGADQKEPLPNELRTMGALTMTVDFIVCNLMDDSRSKSNLALEWYDFIWDRLRAVRKDITQQGICDQQSTILIERCTRFHVHSCYAMNQVKNFDVDMNKRNLNDCLQMLRQMYNDLRATGSLKSPGELEFQRYDILLHLNEDLLATNVSMKTAYHQDPTDLRFITQLFTAYSTRNYYRFFRLMAQADYMTSCILSLHVNHMRLIGLRSIIGACTPNQTVWYPCHFIIETLGFDGVDDLETFATSCGIELREKGTGHFLLLSRDQLSTIGTVSNLAPPRLRKLVESKMNGLGVGQLVYGSAQLPPNPYRQYALTCDARELEVKHPCPAPPSDMFMGETTDIEQEEDGASEEFEEMEEVEEIYEDEEDEEIDEAEEIENMQQDEEIDFDEENEDEEDGDNVDNNDDADDYHDDDDEGNAECDAEGNEGDEKDEQNEAMMKRLEETDEKTDVPEMHCDDDVSAEGICEEVKVAGVLEMEEKKEEEDQSEDEDNRVVPKSVDMPVGRFRKTYKKPCFEHPQPASCVIEADNSKKVSPTKGDRSFIEEMASIKERLADERNTNRILFNIFHIL